jgi:hypothetical protein
VLVGSCGRVTGLVSRCERWITLGRVRCDQQGSEAGVECQEILEGCLPLSTLSVYPAYGQTGLLGMRDRVPNPHKNEPQATIGQNTG